MISTLRNYYSSQSDRTVIIQVYGGHYCDHQRHSNYTLSVPYSRLSQTIQRIHRTGGQIVGIILQVGSLATAKLKAPLQEQQTAPTPKISEPEVLTVPAISAILPESSAEHGAITPVSRICEKRRHSHLPGTVRRKNRKKSRTKAKIYCT